mgnify:CR=1 FL=1
MYKAVFILILTSVLTLVAAVKPAEAKQCPDYNGDGVVTEEDIYALVDRFGTYKGGPTLSSQIKYSKKFDLNSDKRIDLSDILIAVSYLGQECPNDSDDDENDD